MTTTDTRPSITALIALREGWPAELTPVLLDNGEWDGQFDHPDNEHAGRGYIECSSYGMDEAPRFAALIAAEHNVLPVLLEVVKAALAWAEAPVATAAHGAAYRRFAAALAKVRQ